MYFYLFFLAAGVWMLYCEAVAIWSFLLCGAKGSKTALLWMLLSPIHQPSRDKTSCCRVVGYWRNTRSLAYELYTIQPISHVSKRLVSLYIFLKTSKFRTLSVTDLWGSILEVPHKSLQLVVWLLLWTEASISVWQGCIAAARHALLPGREK